MTCSGSQGDPVSPVRGGAGRALYEERLLSRSLCVIQPYIVLILTEVLKITG